MPTAPASSERAYYVPFIAFILLLIIGQVIADFGGTSWVFRESQYWVKPAQTLICGGLLCFYWHSYGFQGARGKSVNWPLGVAVGIVAFLI